MRKAKRPRPSSSPTSQPTENQNPSVQLSDLDSSFDDDDIQIIEAQTSLPLKRKRNSNLTSLDTASTNQQASSSPTQESYSDSANETVMFISETPATRPVRRESEEVQFICEELPNTTDTEYTIEDFAIIESGSTERRPVTRSLSLPRVEFEVDRALIAPPPSHFLNGMIRPFPSLMDHFRRNLETLHEMVGGAPRRNIDRNDSPSPPRPQINLIGSRLDAPLNTSTSPEIITQSSNQTAAQRFEQIRRRQQENSTRLLDKNTSKDQPSNTSSKQKNDAQEEEEEDTASMCPICMLKYKEIKKSPDPDIICLTRCGHVLCFACLHKAKQAAAGQKQNCPVCREKYTKPQVRKIFF